ncbi:esterase/lipase family protein [Streptacidiphilus monticola]|uniref:Esterase/lipase family protein n=1 Tax=Streptacidiphilus monticola TaxID=2161674 RepID=A0ABW1FXG0_9ACTN
MSIPLCSSGLALARCAGLESAALAGHVLMYPVGLHGGDWPLRRPHCLHEEAARHHPVILLHGLFDNRAVFTLLRHHLRVHGWDHVHSLNYNSLALSLPEAAALLGRHVEHTRRVYGGARVALVGHSLGGLVARYYVQRLGGDAHVHTVVTVATPHRGTLAAHLLQPLPIVRQLLPGSAVLEELQRPAPGCATRFLSIWSDLDPVILPQHSARLDHPDLLAENVLVPGVGHLSLPMHGAVLARIREALTPTPEAAAGPAAEVA